MHFFLPRGALPRCAAALAALGLAAAAVAQQPGTYSGFTSQGQPISLQVGLDATGAPALTFVSVVYGAQCALTGATSIDGYAVSTLTPLNAAGGFDKQIYIIRARGALSGTYDGVSGFTGTSSMVEARLLPGVVPPRAEGCDAQVTYQVTRDPGASGAALPAQGLDRRVTARLDASGHVVQLRTEMR